MARWLRKSYWLLGSVLLGLSFGGWWFYSSNTPELYEAPVVERTQAPESIFEYTITAGDELLLELNNVSPSEARERCAAVAYNPDYMWQQVVCTYYGEEIYNDVFIAG